MGPEFLTLEEKKLSREYLFALDRHMCFGEIKAMALSQFEFIRRKRSMHTHSEFHLDRRADASAGRMSDVNLYMFPELGVEGLNVEIQ